MRQIFLSAVAASALVGCAGAGADPVEYRETKLEANSVVFSHIVVAGQEQLFVALSSEGDYCKQFDGLGCIPQAERGRSLTFVLNANEAKNFDVGSSAQARWTDVTERQSTIHDTATSGSVLVKKLEEKDFLEATYNLSLPGGNIEGELTAIHCEFIREYSLRCPEQAL